MNLEIVRTADGSDTFYNPDLDQHYHSVFGAVQESRHIFIETGLLHAIAGFSRDHLHANKPLRILEVGFGTGLDALLTQAESEKHGINIHYTGIEAFPLDECCWARLNYPHLFGSLDYLQTFTRIHLAGWNKPETISPHFSLHKIHATLGNFEPGKNTHDLVYFDAFGPDAQPELWTEQVFLKLFDSLHPGGTLVTYSVKGLVVRALRSAGFRTEKLPGPPGKRHIMRATKG